MTVTVGKGIRTGAFGGWNFSEEENFNLIMDDKFWDSEKK